MSLTIDPIKGLYEIGDGQGNLTVPGTTITNSTYSMPTVLLGSASFGSTVVSILAPGFYQVPATGSTGAGLGAGSFTGSLPSPASFPGGEILVTDTLAAFNWLLTGSIAVNVAGTGGIQTLSSSTGTKLTVTKGGTVGLWSDSKNWLVDAVSGVATLTA